MALFRTANIAFFFALTTGLAYCQSEAEGVDVKSLLKLTDHYSILVIVTHGVLLDIAVISAATLKNRSYYQKLHETAGLLMTILVLMETIVAGVRGIDLSGIMSSQFDAFTLLLFALEVAVGYRVQFIIKATKNGRSYGIEKLIHRLAGIVLFVLLKLKLLSLLKWVLRPDSFFWITVVFYFFASLLTYGYFFLFSDPNPKEEELAELYQKNDDRAYRLLLAAIHAEDAHSGEDGIRFSKLPSERNDQKDSDQEKADAIKWYLFGNKLCEMPDFPHSGGDFLISSADKRDITKAILGITSWVYFNKETKRIHLFRYIHGKKFKNAMRRACFGLYYQPIFNRRRLESRASSELDEERLRLMADSAFDRNYKKHKLYEHSAIQVFMAASFQLGNSEFYACFISKENESTTAYNCDLKHYWPRSLGKYLLTNFQVDGTKLSYFIRFLNPSYLRYRNQFLLSLDAELYAVHASLNTELLMRVLELEDQTGSETTSKYMSTVFHAAHDLRHQNFSLSEQLGFGLGYLTNSSQNYLLVAKNQGILPFIDLFELIFQKLLLYFHGRAAENDVFTSEYRLLFANKFKLSVYWVVDNSFIEAAKTLGLYHLQLLKVVQEKLGSPDAEIIGKVWVESQLLTDQPFDRLKKPLRKANKISDVLSVDTVEYDKVLISGTDGFITQLFEDAHISRRNFAKMVFV